MQLELGVGDTIAGTRDAFIGLTGRYLNCVKAPDNSATGRRREPEPDGSARRSRRIDQLPQRLEDLAKLVVVLAETGANVELRSTPESIATPCSVKTYGE